MLGQQVQTRVGSREERGTLEDAPPLGLLPDEELAWRPALPPSCLRVLSVPRAECPGPACPGWQREDRCVCEVVGAANEQGVRWTFEIDPDGYWVYNGPPLGPDAPVAAPDGPVASEAAHAPSRPVTGVSGAVVGAGTVAVTADEAARYTQFAVSMQGLVLPDGSKTVWQVGNDIAGNRNAAVEGMSGDWVWFVDDDHAFAPDVLLRLLARDVPVVAPLVLRRCQPFSTVACENPGGDILDLREVPRDRLLRVIQTGSSGMLVRRQVLEAIDPPWFELANGVSEDIAFCRKVVEAGFPIYLDPTVTLGHLTTCAVWPVWAEQEQRWLTGFKIADGFDIEVDITVVPDPQGS